MEIVTGTQQYRPILGLGVCSVFNSHGAKGKISKCMRIISRDIATTTVLFISCQYNLRVWCGHGIKIGEGYVSAENTLLLLLLLFSSRAPAGILFMTSTYATVFPLWLCAKNSLIPFSVSFL